MINTYAVAMQCLSKKQLYLITNIVNAVSTAQAISSTCSAFKKTRRTSSFKVASAIKCEIVSEGVKESISYANTDNLIIIEIEPNENTKLQAVYDITVHLVNGDHRYKITNKLTAYSQRQALFITYNKIKSRLGLEDLTFYKVAKVKESHKGTSQEIIDLTDKYFNIQED